MNDNDILKYVKHEYSQIEAVVQLLTNAKNVTRTNLSKLFSNQSKDSPDGRSKIIIPPKYRITDYFDLPAGVLPNQPNAIPDTTLGIFLFNSYILADLFGPLISYINVPMNGKNIEKLIDGLGSLFLHNQLDMDAYAKFFNRLVWLGYQNELFMPGISMELIIPNKKVQQLKLQILKEKPELGKKEHVDLTTVSRYHDEVEVPLINEATNMRKQNYAGRIYDMGKPTFDNNYKNSVVTNGACFDPATGKYKINTNSYQDGVNEWNFDSLANKTMVASYNRGVNTQIGGTYAKYVGIMMQTLRAGPKDSDCGSRMYLNFNVTKDNAETIMYNYAYIDGKEVELTEPVLNKHIGKTIKIRSPLFCKMKDCICNKCIGNIVYLLGITNVGLTTNIPLDTQKNKSMKSMHDMTVKTFPADPKAYIEFTK